MVYSGGCLCGAIRYRIEAQPDFPHTCSCRQCQRWSGAPLMGWVDFPRAAVRFDGPGEPRLYRSSPGTQRGFCPTCGSALFALDDGSETLCLATGTLDEPDAVVPETQSFADEAPGWLPPAPPVKAGR